MQIINKLKKYFDLPYILILFGLILLIRAVVLLDYNDLALSSFGNFISPIGLILTMIFVIKVIRK